MNVQDAAGGLDERERRRTRWQRQATALGDTTRRLQDLHAAVDSMAAAESAGAAVPRRPRRLEDELLPAVDALAAETDGGAVEATGAAAASRRSALSPHTLC